MKVHVINEKRVLFQKRERVFHWVSKHEKTDESTK